MLDHTIVKTHTRSPFVRVALVKRDSESRYAVVILDDKSNQVRFGKSFAGPVNDSRAVEYVAHWKSEKAAEELFKLVTS